MFYLLSSTALVCFQGQPECFGVSPKYQFQGALTDPSPPCFLKCYCFLTSIGVSQQYRTIKKLLKSAACAAVERRVTTHPWVWEYPHFQDLWEHLLFPPKLMLCLHLTVVCRVGWPQTHQAAGLTELASGNQNTAVFENTKLSIPFFNFSTLDHKEVDGK